VCAVGDWCVCVCVCVWAEEPVVAAANGCIMIQLPLMMLNVQRYLGSKPTLGGTGAVLVG